MEQLNFAMNTAGMVKGSSLVSPVMQILQLGTVSACTILQPSHQAITRMNEARENRTVYFATVEFLFFFLSCSLLSGRDDAYIKQDLSGPPLCMSFS
jgi:hypothetical protein